MTNEQLRDAKCLNMMKNLRPALTDCALLLRQESADSEDPWVSTSFSVFVFIPVLPLLVKLLKNTLGLTLGKIRQIIVVGCYINKPVEM